MTPCVCLTSVPAMASSASTCRKRLKPKRLSVLTSLMRLKRRSSAIGRGCSDDYYVMDLSQPDEQERRKLGGWNFNALVTVAALGFGDIPTKAFVNAFNIVENNSWIAFNIKDRFFSDDDDTGYNQMLQEMIGNSLQVYKKHHYCHRLSMAGEPLYYYAVIGRKENDF
jgi:hypothetical protein